MRTKGLPYIHHDLVIGAFGMALSHYTLSQHHLLYNREFTRL